MLLIFFISIVLFKKIIIIIIIFFLFVFNLFFFYHLLHIFFPIATTIVLYSLSLFFFPNISRNCYFNFILNWISKNNNKNYVKQKKKERKYPWHGKKLLETDKNYFNYNFWNCDKMKFISKYFYDEINECVENWQCTLFGWLIKKIIFIYKFYF